MCDPDAQRPPKLADGWDATDEVLAKCALRATLEANKTRPSINITRVSALKKTPWLMAWLERVREAVTAGDGWDVLAEAGRYVMRPGC